jgi:kinesin family protein 4/21/27
VLASHNLNDLSSRSHTIFCLTIESQDITHNEMVTVSKLQLVDLAGSEKQALTGTTGIQAKESIDINKSLLVLRKVITALTDQKQGNQADKMSFVPYRESKLTCLLKQSLGGNSYTLMVACLSPSDRYLEENLSTLNYAARASLISNVPTKNIDPRLLEIDEQKRRIHELEKELKNANNHI